MSAERPMYWRELPSGAAVPGDRDDFVRAIEHADRTVARDQIGEVLVSTVFLALDHQYGNGPPLLYETMVFVDGESGEWQWRYHTRESAEIGHRRVLEAVLAGQDLDGLEVEP